MSGSRRKTTNTASSVHNRDQTLEVIIEDSLDVLDGAVLQYEINLIKKHCCELLESILNK